MLSERNYRALLEYRVEKETGPKMTDQIRYFKDCGYIRAGRHDLRERPGEFFMTPTAWIITPRGEDALAEFEYVHNKDSQDERHQGFARKMQILNIAIPLITFIAGLLAEHFSGIVSWIVSLF